MTRRRHCSPLLRGVQRLIHYRFFRYTITGGFDIGLRYAYTSNVRRGSWPANLAELSLLPVGYIL